MKARTGFPFHHGSVSLSFAGSVSDRGSVPAERIESPQALSEWLAAAGLIERPANIGRSTFERAIQLREAIASVARALAGDARPARRDIETINDAVRRFASRTTLDEATLAVREEARDAVHAALGRLARDAVHVLGTAHERARLRVCRSQTCAAVFLAPAGAKERLWCSMARCGNRAKVSAFRERSHHR